MVSKRYRNRKEVAREGVGKYEWWTAAERWSGDDVFKQIAFTQTGGSPTEHSCNGIRLPWCAPGGERANLESKQFHPALKTEIVSILFEVAKFDFARTFAHTGTNTGALDPTQRFAQKFD